MVFRRHHYILMGLLGFSPTFFSRVTPILWGDDVRAIFFIPFLFLELALVIGIAFFLFSLFIRLEEKKKKFGQ